MAVVAGGERRRVEELGEVEAWVVELKIDRFLARDGSGHQAKLLRVFSLTLRWRNALATSGSGSASHNAIGAGARGRGFGCGLAGASPRHWESI